MLYYFKILNDVTTCILLDLKNLIWTMNNLHFNGNRKNLDPKLVSLTFIQFQTKPFNLLVNWNGVSLTIEMDISRLTVYHLSTTYRP